MGKAITKEVKYWPPLYGLDIKVLTYCSVVFSFWTKMLDLIEVALKSKGISFCRIDGQASMKQRREALESFENESGHSLMLASISAAGEGSDSIITTFLSSLLTKWAGLTSQRQALFTLWNHIGTLW